MNGHRAVLAYDVEHVVGKMGEEVLSQSRSRCVCCLSDYASDIRSAEQRFLVVEVMGHGADLVHVYHRMRHLVV